MSLCRPSAHDLLQWLAGQGPTLTVVALLRTFCNRANLVDQNSELLTVLPNVFPPRTFRPLQTLPEA